MSGMIKERCEITVATKKLVDSLLAMNTSNRPVKQSVVDRYARDIARGEWMLTNQGIGVNENGVLADGQHRLLALKKCGYPSVNILVVWGLTEKAQSVVDGQAKRSARDVFALLYNAAVARSAPAICVLIERAVEGEKKTGAGNGGLSISETYSIYEKYADEIDVVCGGVKEINFYPAPVLAAAVVYLKNNPQKSVEILEFLDALKNGENLNKTMPVFHLRNYLLSSRKTSGNGPERIERYQKTKKALDAFVQNKTMAVLRV